MNDIISNKASIEAIINAEWEMFQQVNNIGGRASCQDDFETFYIMRFSQYASWTEEMVEYYLKFVNSSFAAGRNLVSEKYGRMMKYTHPDYYKREIEPFVSPVTEGQITFINQIVKQMVYWEKDFSKEYPKLSAAGRPISSDMDEGGFTSMETYARGEFETYPLEFLSLYAEYVLNLKKSGKSLSVINQEIMVKLYGYNSIEEAESSL